MRILIPLLFILIFNSTTFASPKQDIGNEKILNEKTYQDIMLLLDKDDKFLGYNDLLKIYDTIIASQNTIPGIEKIYLRLLEERNEHPRVDQMILIYSAQLIGISKQKIQNIVDLLETLILSERANLWTISFAAGALGEYFIELEEGSRLADMIDKRIDYLIEKEANSNDEFFGVHFLPPPTTIYIKDIISTPKQQKRRESTRFYYYKLRTVYSEKQIKKYLIYLDKHGDIKTNKKIDFSMKYLFKNIELIKAVIAKKTKT